MKKKFLIYAPSYNENNGGSIVEHKLCSILNNLGYEAYLHPLYTRFFEINKNTYHLSFRTLVGFIVSTIRKLYKDFRIYKNFKMNPAMNTQLFDQKNTNFGEDWVIIYPEIAFGNPLKAKNVVRWLLHQPGFHTGQVFYGQNELIFKFNSAIDDFDHVGCKTSDNELKVIHYPLEFYYNDKSLERKGTAYCLRKGKDKLIQHDLTDSVLIDGKSHKEVADIFRQVKTFVSYDTYTAYSIFAVLCGCESIVVPDEGVSEDEWYPNEQDRWGISYGFDNMENAKNTASLVLKHILSEEKKSINNVENFVSEVEDYFD
tara:strand:- start:193453 stop:194397 length:945 start_codon:yes stop_codon:yes gene_type:complete